jgi:predicted membrane-bound spermidine synthase
MAYSIRRVELALLAIFIVSGFAGLIYQSVWSHYLGLTLGHAAYAQSLVLGIFMGGMAIGALLASRVADSRRRLIYSYGVIEGIVGIAGLVFHSVFVAYTHVSQNSVLPSLDSPAMAHAYQWISAALLLLPQSILLGTTFPLMSAGYLRIAPADDSKILGGLYFSNSAGAAFGALGATFVLLPWVGMPGAMVSAGVLNLVVAVAAIAVSLYVKESPAGGPEGSRESAAKPTTESTATSPAADQPDKSLLVAVLAASFITGATSFVYEVGWVRLLNLALGTTVHSFELMLSAFILGLALGGLYVRRRSANLTRPLRMAGIAQVLMGIATLLSLLVYTQAFTWVEWVMSAVQRSPSGYLLFLGGSAVLAILVMLPAAFFAGMTLPLFTAALLRRGHGNSVIGKVYAANTLGAITGVLAAVHVLIPLMGVKLSLVLAGLGDAALGVWLLRFYNESARRRSYVIGAFASLVTAVLVMQFARVDPLVMAGGVFRTGRASLHPDTKLHYLRDGKTATVAFYQVPDSKALISTNGKTDASITMDASRPRSPDEVTMVIAGGLPIAVHPNPGSIAIIGFGSGLTTHTVLGSPAPKFVNTIEIESAMVEGARLFGPYVERAYNDPRSQIRIDDARTYFATGSRKYDVIISEPSNPWVSGVAGLFTQEFYEFVIRHLNPGGVLVQWVQAYEISDPLVATMLRALVDKFPHVDLYVSNTSDLIMVASPHGPVPKLDFSRVMVEPLGGEMARQGLAKESDLTIRKLMDERLIRAYTRVFNATPHSDFYPTVSLKGPQTRHANQTAFTFLALASSGYPILEVLGVRPFVDEQATQIPDMSNYIVQSQQRAREVLDGLREPLLPEALLASPSPVGASLARLYQLSARCVSDEMAGVWADAALEIAEPTFGYYRIEVGQSIWVAPHWMRCDAPERESGYVGLMLRLFDAVARRDHAAQRALAVEALQSAPAALPDDAKERLVLLATLGAIGAGEPGDVDALWQAHGKNLRQSDFLGILQGLVRAWAEARAEELAAQTPTGGAGG